MAFESAINCREEALNNSDRFFNNIGKIFKDFVSKIKIGKSISERKEEINRLKKNYDNKLNTKYLPIKESLKSKERKIVVNYYGEEGIQEILNNTRNELLNEKAKIVTECNLVKDLIRAQEYCSNSIDLRSRNNPAIKILANEENGERPFKLFKNLAEGIRNLCSNGEKFGEKIITYKDLNKYIDNFFRDVNGNAENLRATKKDLELLFSFLYYFKGFAEEKSIYVDKKYGEKDEISCRYIETHLVVLKSVSGGEIRDKEDWLNFFIQEITVLILALEKLKGYFLLNIKEDTIPNNIYEMVNYRVIEKVEMEEAMKKVKEKMEKIRADKSKSIKTITNNIQHRLISK